MKRLIKRHMPSHHVIRNHQQLRFFGKLLHDPNLWHLNRRSVSGAFAVGCFNAWVPVPFQMVLSAAAAILCRVNLPISVALVWITNPVTMPPIFYFAYVVGTWFLGVPVREVEFEISLAWLGAELGAIWKPFLLGCLICGLVSSALGYATMRGLWRLTVVRNLRARRLLHLRRRRANETKREQTGAPAEPTKR